MDSCWIHLRVTVGNFIYTPLEKSYAYGIFEKPCLISPGWLLAGDADEVLSYGCLSEPYTSVPNRGK